MRRQGFCLPYRWTTDILPITDTVLPHVLESLHTLVITNKKVNARSERTASTVEMSQECFGFRTGLGTQE